MIVALLVSGGLLAGTQALVAHHAGTMFSDEVKEITGTVKEFQFTNPHSWIQVMVETKPGEPPQEWSVEWGSPNQLGRNGIRPSTFKPGVEGDDAHSSDARRLAGGRLRGREVRRRQDRRQLEVSLKND